MKSYAISDEQPLRVIGRVKGFLADQPLGKGQKRLGFLLSGVATKQWSLLFLEESVECWELGFVPELMVRNNCVFITVFKHISDDQCRSVVEKWVDQTNSVYPCLTDEQIAMILTKMDD